MNEPNYQRTDFEQGQIWMDEGGEKWLVVSTYNAREYRLVPYPYRVVEDTAKPLMLLTGYYEGDMDLFREVV